ncbi:extracellular substrate binding-like orphan protein GrrP [Cyanobium sp. NIES-981]|uniref:extracellular substrate binding-like orphan protein GrrP n=1 Tax=Cyanobium sp. NIES-981 TaxID=1851505 RepID=UPI001CED1CCA|nr:extracellular substrate binding-like orphan protein GrrP [Cyanobium sp. NIES-981]
MRDRLRGACGSLLGLGLLFTAAAGSPAWAAGVVERVAGTGELVLVGPATIPPLLSREGEGPPQGYAVLVAERIAAALAEAVGRPVKLRFEEEPDLATTGGRVVAGTADLACGFPFSWEADMTADFSLPIGVSGLRLLTPAGRFDGDPAGLAGHRLAVVRGSLAASELQGFQPRAVPVPVNTLRDGLDALQAGRVEGVIGDSNLLAALASRRGLGDLRLVPEVPYESYAIACLLPENDSAFRNLVDLAIARLLQGYVDGRPEDVAAVDRWIGPGSAADLSQELIRDQFQALLMAREAIRPLPPAGRRAPAARPAI